MNPVYAHIMIVHVPVVGVVFTIAVMLFGAITGERKIALFGCALTVVCAVAAIAAYATGPPAYESVESTLDEPTRTLAERHAVAGRAAFILTLLAGIVALQALLRTAAAEMPSPWLIRGLAVLLLVLAGILGWTAHLGGGLAHPESRSSESSSP